MVFIAIHISSLTKTSHFYSHRIIYFIRKLTPAIHFSQVLQGIHLAEVGNVIQLKMPKQRPMPGSFDSKGKTQETIDAMPVRQVFCYSNGTHASTTIKPMWMPPSPSSHTSAAPSNSQISPHTSQSHQ